MKKHLEKSIKPIVLGLYSLSAVIGLYTILTVYNSYSYISGLVTNSGLVISDELLSVITYYMSSSVPYLFYTVSIFSIGYIINKVHYLIKIVENNNNDLDKESTDNNENDDEDKDDNDLDSIIEELRNNK